VDYVDFAQWQRQSMQGPVLERELAYWKHKLAGAPSAVALPVEHAVAGCSTAKAGRRAILLEKHVVEAMAGLGQQESLTPFMLLMSALVVTFHKWTQQKDLVIGTVVAGRNRRELEKVIGCFMNFVPIRTRILGPETGNEILAKVKASILDGQNHQECPFEKIVEAVNPERRGNQNPLYNVAFLLQNFPTNLFPSPTLDVRPVPVSLESALLDLRFEAEQTVEGLSMACEYRVDLFETGTIDELLRSFLHVLSTLVQNPHARLDDFSLTESLELQARNTRARLETQLVAVAATFTAEPIAESLRYWMTELEIPGSVEFALYNQIFQQLLDPGSLLGSNPRGLNLVLLRFDDWRGEADGNDPLSLNKRVGNIERSIADFVAGLRTACARTSVPWVICVCPSSGRLGGGDDASEVHGRLEELLTKGLSGLVGVHLLTTAELLRNFPAADCLDQTSDELGHVPYTPLFFTALGTAVARKFHAL
jgi:hypothetical protein